ncbi:MAG: Omp28-related outer membrane protein [Bacteroidetes bacterium]|nr:Omp28-related outer membrane protein [Bacteroidota bacterium]
MKSLLLIPAFTFYFLQLSSQTIVSTNPENKNAIIEEFTGIACGFCPYGHKEVEEFIASHPNDGFSIAYHQGFYAIPDPGQPDYRTTYGDGLGAYFSVNGWPNAMINRHDFGGGYLYTFNQWQQYGNQVLNETAYVNMASEATLDVQSRELSVHVEVYYTGNSPEPENNLNVAITQNNVKGVQFSSWFNPDAITPDGEYLHQHMFRDFITGQWGEALSPTTTGSFIDKYYVYNVPEEINDIPIRLGDIEIVNFISESENAVETASASIPVLTNFAYSLDAGIDLLELPETSCSYINSKVTIGNYGSENITSLGFSISINGEAPVEYNVEIEPLMPFTSAEIEIPAVFFGGMGSNDYSITIFEVNGATDENPSNNIAQNNFNDAVEVVLPVTLHLETDNYFGTAWYLYDDQNNVIQQGSGYDYNSTYNIDLEVDAGCYHFVMTDLDGYFFGSYSLVDGDNQTIVSTNTGFGNKETTAFTLPIYEPTAMIDASTSILCIGGTVQFMDASSGGPSEWQWTFEGGDPEMSSEKNPLVSYPAPGTYDVSLSVTNSLGSDDILMEDYITVTSLSFGNLALEYDGTDDYVEVSNESAFDFITDITLEVWIKPNSLTGTQGVISKNFGNNAHPYQIRLLNDEVLFGFYSNTIGWQPIQTTSANLLVGEWAHIACTYNMEEVKIFVNGIQKAIGYKNFQIPQNDQPLEIGRTKDVAFEYYSGTIDEVRVWDIALTAQQIEENMCTNFSGSTDPHLIANFKFNECGGTLLTDSKNGYDGVLMGMEGNEWVESYACPSYNIQFLVTEDPGNIPVEDATINMSGTIRYTNTSGEADFDGYEPGNYNYTVSKDGYTLASGSFALVDEDLMIDVSLLINKADVSRADDISIFPNPSSGEFTIRLNKSAYLQIFDVSGCEIKNMELRPGQSQFNLKHYQAGLYYVKLRGANDVQFFKIILQ